ncbi:TRAP dicarboxylate transporter subunit DctP [Nitratireductor indicus C115]|uniref:TRAP dicarboxylate transporter subunit DctP n=1 Tax=Nitratireductor indicus C115 TaxID=1231190 RepID=K2P9E3_9HYPH|nr:TRAP transporter substrate-binding protein DctP [Nitratireductor indicus]EKF43811.1 TRAP dicarboxylate transporter subunit DctP [Nitratireductor indicus C115]SFQ16422.1 TRAP-type C4-dicarboxylate transport system, substrate-binding protein [Nitratireductor indicus]
MKRVSILAAVAMALAAAVPARAETLTMLSSWDESYNAVPVFAQEFAKRLTEKSGGELSVEMRGPETVPPFEQLQPVSAGLFNMLFTHGAYHLGETTMAFGMDAVKDDPQARRESGIYDLIDAHYQQRNLKLIGVFSAASGYHILLKNPIAEDGALKGRKIRASGTYHDLVNELGGSVVTLPASEIYSALERGVVDGAAWPVFGAMDYKWYEVAGYMTRPTFGITNLSLFMNLDTWNGLSAEQQTMVTDIAKELEIEGRKHFEGLWAKEDKAMQDAGLAITEFGPDVAGKVDGIFAAGVWKQVEDKAGEDGKAFHKLALEKNLTAQ